MRAYRQFKSGFIFLDNLASRFSSNLVITFLFFSLFLFICKISLTSVASFPLSLKCDQANKQKHVENKMNSLFGDKRTYLSVIDRVSAAQIWRKVIIILLTFQSRLYKEYRHQIQ